jgi:FAD/FMN-containing dehydrogenase
MEQPTPTATAVARLRASLTGRIVDPGDGEYERMRSVVYGNLAGHPAVIARVANANDVAAAVRIADECGLELAVRSGGHSVAGHSSTEGGLVIDLRDMKGLKIDAAAGTAWAETGLTAAEVTGAAADDGLAIGFGDAGSVGIGGITLGGGVGFLTRKYGLTIDSLLAAEIVTADGSIVHTDADNHPDLFWAIRGGGGNFGVATRLKFRLHPLKQIVGGMLFLPATPDTVAGFVAAAEAAPDELSTIANVMPAPPMPFLPESVHGKLVILGMLAYAGEPATGERVLAPFRKLAQPIADMVRPMQLPELYPPEDPDYHPTAVARTMFVDHIDHGVAAMILKTLAASDASMRVAQLRVLGGAASRVPVDATAYAHRASRIMVNVAVFYNGLEDRPHREAWATDFAASVRQSDTGAYSNFLADEGEGRVRAAYPGTTWDRLVAVKRRYDPGNLFRRNQNISPA